MRGLRRLAKEAPDSRIQVAALRGTETFLHRSSRAVEFVRGL